MINLIMPKEAAPVAAFFYSRLTSREPRAADLNRDPDTLGRGPWAVGRGSRAVVRA